MADCCNHFSFTDDGDSFESWQGLRGPYYIPHLSADGVLSWTNTGSLPNPAPVDISGPPGSSVELRGPVPSVEDLPATAPSGELWLVGSASPYDGWFYNGASWENAGQIAVGPPGADGVSPEVTIAQISGGHSVTITDAEHPSGQTFDVMDGEDGADGKSAYESAQDGGYSGTEQQFYTELAEVGDKLDLSGGTMTGALNMGSHKITNVLAGTDDSDAVNLGQVSGMISTNTAYFRGSFATKAALLAVAWQTSDPSAAYYVTNNDYAIVEDDETQNDECWRYVYVSGTGWAAQYKINETPLTPAQIAALNSGATSTNISAIADKLDKTGDGKDVTVTFSAAASRTAIATGEKLSVLFGKILKWLSDLGTAAFRAATSSITSGSTDLIESGAVYTGLEGKAEAATYTGTLAAASWSGASAPYSQALTVNGLLASDTPTVDVVMSGTYSTDDARNSAWAAIYRAVTSADTLTVYASELPTVDLPIQIQCVR